MLPANAAFGDVFALLNSQNTVTITTNTSIAITITTTAGTLKVCFTN